MQKFTADQKKAIAQLRRAFTAVQKTGLKATSMDSQLYIVCGDGDAHAECEGSYSPVGNAIQSQRFEYAFVGKLDDTGAW